ncbi:Hsp20/alpha crystallin family protein [Bacillus alkalicellulosilyticus]|uniref:Hsp20/alpha crystallin family protein n=1 Tax=Alkalihalobacterium alkalicellulosilyticum TaxID=1912214 RepID=UPI0011166340|nr:Hsp20/alpha crystallin family protein [Bacillus alkalicellulosilyticus]
MKDDKNLPNVQHSYQDFLKSIDSFFTETFKNFHLSGLFAPSFPVRTYETNSEFVIEAHLPGIKKEQITLDVSDYFVRITVKDEEIIEERNDNEQLISHFHSSQLRERVIPVPFSITEKDAKASHNNGLLTIRIPNKRKTIEIE